MNTPQERTNAALLDIVERCLRLLTREDALPEPERARIHALTQTVRVSDTDLQTLFRDGLNRIKRGETSDRTPILPCGAPGDNCAPDFFMMLCDLRDRYEERGKYAPHQAATVAESGTNES